GGVVAFQGLGGDGDAAGLVLAGDGVGGGAVGDLGKLAQGVHLGHLAAVGGVVGGVEGHIHQVLDGQGVGIVHDPDGHALAVDADGGGIGRGGQPDGDALVRLGHRQTGGAGLVLVDVQLDGLVACAEAGGGVGKALVAVDHLDHLFDQAVQVDEFVAVNGHRQAAAPQASDLRAAVDGDGAGAVVGGSDLIKRLTIPCGVVRTGAGFQVDVIGIVVVTGPGAG